MWKVQDARKGLAAFRYAAAGTRAQWDHLQRTDRRGGKGRKAHTGLQLVDELRQQVLKPDVITYSARIYQCMRKKGRMTGRALQQQGLEPN